MGGDLADQVRFVLDANKKNCRLSIFESGGAHYRTGACLTWNYAGMTIDADNICFVNSVFGFSPG